MQPELRSNVHSGSRHALGSCGYEGIKHSERSAINPQPNSNQSEADKARGARATGKHLLRLPSADIRAIVVACLTWLREFRTDASLDFVSPFVSPRIFSGQASGQGTTHMRCPNWRAHMAALAGALCIISAAPTISRSEVGQATLKQFESLIKQYREVLIRRALRRG